MYDFISRHKNTLHPSQHLGFRLILSIQLGVYLFICITLMSSDNGNNFICLPFIYLLVRSVDTNLFYFGLLVFSVMCCKCSLHLLNASLLTYVCSITVFSHYTACILFPLQYRHLIFIKASFYYLFLSWHAFYFLRNTYLLKSRSKDTFPVLSSRNFIVLALTFRSTFHFQY